MDRLLTRKKRPHLTMLLRRLVWLVPIFILLIGLGQHVSAQLTQCDVDALIEQHPYYDTCAENQCSTLSGNDNEEKIWNFLTGNGLSAVAAAGLMGNFQTETAGSWDPRINNGGDKTDYPKSNSIAYGLAQWLGGRQDDLVESARDAGVIAGDLELQLNFVMDELHGGYESSTLDPLGSITGTDRAATDQATKIVYDNYERPGPSDHSLGVRQQNAWDIYQHFNGTGGSNNSGSCVTSSCSPNGPPSSTNTVVLDPGHGQNFTQIDSQTGLAMIESHNVPEINEVWDVTQKVKAKLEADGYNVILTKTDVDGEGVTFRDRADVANKANAAIAVSIHDDHGQNFDSFKHIYYQFVGGYRQVEVGDPARKGQKVTFNDQAVADKSLAYAQIMSKERQASEGNSVTVDKDDFSGRGLEPGTLSMVQLFAKVPWIYNEVGVNAANPNEAMNSAQEDKYASGIINGVEKAVPLNTQQQNSPSGGSPTGSSSSGPNAAILCEAEKYAGIWYKWGGGHGDFNSFRAACPEEALATAAADSHPDPNQGPCGVDCSGLVNVSVDQIYNQNISWSVSTDGKMENGPDYWKSISMTDAQAGDIVTRRNATGHVEIVDHVQGNTVYTFGAHSSKEVIGLASHNSSFWNGGAWRYTGPGATND